MGTVDPFRGYVMHGDRDPQHGRERDQIRADMAVGTGVYAEVCCLQIPSMAISQVPQNDIEVRDPTPYDLDLPSH